MEIPPVRVPIPHRFIPFVVDVVADVVVDVVADVVVDVVVDVVAGVVVGVVGDAGMEWTGISSGGREDMETS